MEIELKQYAENLGWNAGLAIEFTQTKNFDNFEQSFIAKLPQKGIFNYTLTNVTLEQFQQMDSNKQALIVAKLLKYGSMRTKSREMCN